MENVKKSLSGKCDCFEYAILSIVIYFRWLIAGYRHQSYSCIFRKTIILAEIATENVFIQIQSLNGNKLVFCNFFSCFPIIVRSMNVPRNVHIWFESIKKFRMKTNVSDYLK